MNPAMRQFNRLESVISILQVSILFLIAAAIFVLQKPKTALKKEANLNNLAPVGFAAFSDMETYDSENLYEKIDGKAPLYTESGFEKLQTQRFADKNNPDKIGMEIYIYDMGNIRNAFSVYSVQRRAEAEPLPDMKFAYKAGNALFLVHGKYYIELIGFSEEDSLSKVMNEVVQKYRTNLTVSGETDIPELNLFAHENLIAESAKLYLKDAFGFEGLTNTFTAQYKFGNNVITAFFSKCLDQKIAQQTAENYCSFLVSNGGIIKPVASKIPGCKIIDLSGSIEIVFATGPFAAGIHEAENQRAAEKIAINLFDKLSSVKQ
jgi:hypothetical protein